MRLYGRKAMRPHVGEFHFSDEDFDSLRNIVKSHIGIHLSEQKRQMVYGRVSRRLRALGLRDFRDYRALLGETGSQEVVALCNAITTNLTAFFREKHHFEFIETQLLARQADGVNTGRRLRFWCAGCSTGEEPYSLAIVVCKSMKDLERWDIRILATDVDTDVLDRAARGIYASERVGGMEPAILDTYFRLQTVGGTTQYAVTDQIRQLVHFKPLNLIHEWPMKGPLDAVFCRNVAIYFDNDTRRELYARIAKLQRPGSLLFVGHSESLFRVSEVYALVGKTIYRRR